MRLLGFLIFTSLLLTVSACKSQKANLKKTTMADGKVLLKIDSLKNTAKKLYIHNNKKLEVSELNGSLVYKIVDSENTNVIQFSYEKDMDKVAYDGGYREEVVFELPGSITQKSFADAQLQDTKMLFGRYCFCRGQTGLYKVGKGKLQVTPSTNEVHFELQFKIEEVPQVTDEIKY